METSPHLHFKGNCEEALRFYAESLGGRIVFKMTFGEAPDAQMAPAGWRDKIAHARLDLGNQVILGCDASPDRYHAPQGFNLMASVETSTDAERIFKALSRDGTVDMPFQETFWAHRFGMCTDRFGIPWMVNCPKPLEAVAGQARKSA